MDLDAVAETAVADLHRLAAIWRENGAAALDAAIRADRGWIFAIRDGRPEGTLRLIAARLGDAPVFSFVDPAGAEAIVVRCDRVVLCTDPTLSRIVVGPQDERLAEELAWRLSIAVDEEVRVPAGFDADPNTLAWHRGPFSDVALLRALDAAQRMLDGQLPFIAGAREVHFDLRDAGIEPTPHTLYFIQDESYEIDGGRPGSAERSREQQRADLEAWSRTHARADCEALLARYHGPDFGGAHG